MRSPLHTLMIATEARRRRAAAKCATRPESRDCAEKVIGFLTTKPFSQANVTHLVNVLIASQDGSIHFDKAEVKDHLYNFNQAMNDDDKLAALYALHELRSSTAGIDYMLSDRVTVKAEDMISAHIIAFKKCNLACEALGALTIS
ncbi:MAG: hypothetical protein P1U63_07935 [Coxiellaceae bacterium]|nr:hypothetical protein [Coxiellaceae bacterium]